MNAIDLFESPDTIYAIDDSGKKTSSKYYESGNHSFVVSRDGMAGAISKEPDTGHYDLIDAIKDAPFAIVALPSYDKLYEYAKENGVWRNISTYFDMEGGRVWTNQKVVSFWLSALMLREEPKYLKMAGQLMNAIGHDIKEYAIDAIGVTDGKYPSYDQFMAGKLSSEEVETPEAKKEREELGRKTELFKKAIQGKKSWEPRDKPEPGSEDKLPTWGDSAIDIVNRMLD